MRAFLSIVSLIFCLAVSGAPARGANQTWTVIAGGGVPGASVVANSFQPRTIEIAVGDTVTWAFVQPWGVHTVTFLGREKPPDVEIRDGDNTYYNPKVFFSVPVPYCYTLQCVASPIGGNTYDGTSYVNSGWHTRPLANTAPYSLTFTKAGTFEYRCLVHAAMVGTVVVKERVSASPAEVAARGRSELAATLQAGRAAFSKLNPERLGNTLVVPMIGDSKSGWSVFRFTPDPLVVERGTTVTWTMRDPLELHTVTFPSGEQLPAFAIFQPQPQGPPKVLWNPRVISRTQTSTYDGTGFVNSGLLYPPGEPGNPPTSFSLTFTQPGRYVYWCVLHAPEGMKGVIIVK